MKTPTRGMRSQGWTQRRSLRVASEDVPHSPTLASRTNSETELPRTWKRELGEVVRRYIPYGLEEDVRILNEPFDVRHGLELPHGLFHDVDDRRNETPTRRHARPTTILRSTCVELLTDHRCDLELRLPCEAEGVKVLEEDSAGLWWNL